MDSLKAQREVIKAQIREICKGQPTLNRVESAGLYYIIQAASLAASGCPSWQSLRRVEVTKADSRKLVVKGEPQPRNYWKDYLIVPSDRVEEVKELQVKAEQLRQLELAAIKLVQGLTVDKIRSLEPEKVQQFVNLFGESA